MTPNGFLRLDPECQRPSANALNIVSHVNGTRGPRMPRQSETWVEPLGRKLEIGSYFRDRDIEHTKGEHTKGLKPQPITTFAVQFSRF